MIEIRIGNTKKTAHIKIKNNEWKTTPKNRKTRKPPCKMDT